MVKSFSTLAEFRENHHATLLSEGKKMNERKLYCSSASYRGLFVGMAVGMCQSSVMMEVLILPSRRKVLLRRTRPCDSWERHIRFSRIDREGIWWWAVSRSATRWMKT